MATGIDLLPANASAKKQNGAPSRSKINVVLFSGGSGTQSITETLRQHPQISLKILINAYDDGHSTGRLRRFIPGMLGPSDVRKNIGRLMPLVERSQTSLQAISDYRLPLGCSREDALAILHAILRDDTAGLPERLAQSLPKMAAWQLATLKSYFRTFLDYFGEQEQQRRTFDFTDCALGNLLFAGCYLQNRQDFNATIQAFSAFYEVAPGILLNVTLGENLFLVAEKENGLVLRNEADIVAAQDTSRIRDLFLIDEPTYLDPVESGAEPAEGWRAFLRTAHRIPGLNPEAKTALAEADVIIYGPGTQHSSLFPSYMTNGVAEAIAGNARADKVFIGNIHKDFDIQEDDASDLARKLLDAMSRKGQVSVDWTAVVSHFFVQATDENTVAKAKYVPFDRSKFAFPIETVRAQDWEAQEGRHAGGLVLDELRQIVQSKIDVELASLHHMVSIVVPVWNEEATVVQVLKSLTAIDLQALNLTKEVILVDGGSTDRTAELARTVPNVKVFALNGVFGRGAAMRLGLQKARGNIVVFFPGDAEYNPDDIGVVISSLVNSSFRVVFGTRAVKCTDLTGRLKQVYDNNRRLYLTSKYGGMLLSIVTLLLYNRYVTDVLSTLKAYDAQLLRSLALECNGLDLETEIVAKLSRRQEYMLEVPVSYKPRTQKEGKKIRGSDGWRALMALVRFRMRN
jgi:2-phospho-L-lactate transferase/gluconeogenesis factor (CofD/UPF0052 family)